MCTMQTKNFKVFPWHFQKTTNGRSFMFFASRQANQRLLSLWPSCKLKTRSQDSGKPSNFHRLPLLNHFIVRGFNHFHVNQAIIFVPSFQIASRNPLVHDVIANFHMRWRNRLIRQLSVWSQGARPGDSAQKRLIIYSLDKLNYIF